MYDFAHDADPQAAGYGAPPLLLTAAEAFRFPVELTSSLVSDLVLPPRRTVDGEPRPVLVLPGFMADDPLTARLRGHLRRQGYAAHGWGLGRNVGLTDTIVDGLLERRELRGLRDAQRRPRRLSDARHHVLALGVATAAARPAARAAPAQRRLALPRRPA